MARRVTVVGVAGGGMIGGMDAYRGNPFAATVNAVYLSQLVPRVSCVVPWMPGTRFGCVVRDGSGGMGARVPARLRRRATAVRRRRADLRAFLALANELPAPPDKYDREEAGAWCDGWNGAMDAAERAMRR